MQQPVLIRKANWEDVRFITSSWLNSFREAPAVKGVPNSIYYYYHHKILEEVIPRSVVLVACNEEEPSQILGWICAEVVDTALLVHFVYTKYAYRKMGIARMLVNTLKESENPPAILYSHKTYGGDRVLKFKNLDWYYNPYLLYERLDYGWSQDPG